jgi:hypothetical protein
MRNMTRFTLFTKYTATVRFRRGGQWVVKPECEAIDGKKATFLAGWLIEAEDSSIYAGETAMVPMPVDHHWPLSFVASGDLVDIEPVASI